MTREEKFNLLNELLEYEENNDIGNLTRAERREFQQWIGEALEQEPQTFEWCKTCREYDQEKHCCHRWSKVIRNTVEEMKQPCKDAISRDDALKLIRDCGNCDSKSAYGIIYYGVEALPPVQPKPIECEDTISRAETLKAINKMDIPEDMSVFEIKSHIGVEIGTLPPVQPKPKTGHWVEYTRVLIPEPINKWEQAWYCSECGYGNQDSDESAWLEWNYCPQCGARMVEPQESEETDADID